MRSALILVALLAGAAMVPLTAVLSAPASLPASDVLPASMGEPAAEEREVKRCELLAGSPTTRVRSTNVVQHDVTKLATGKGQVFVDNVESCFFDPPPHPAWIRVDLERARVSGGLDVFFRDANMTFLPNERGCATTAVREMCQVPPQARHANVDASSGLQLTVVIREVEP